MNDQALQIKVKYFDNQPKRLSQVENSDWIDLYTIDEDIKMPLLIPTRVHLGIAIELPEGYEAIIEPRSSTLRRYGVVASTSIIDNSYCGDTDEWGFEGICVSATEHDKLQIPFYYGGMALFSNKDMKPSLYSTIPAGSRICQFRIQKKMPKLDIQTVDTLGNKPRGGLGSTGI